ncbi:MAG: hypothetical protein J6T39_03170, partial [Clostridia bacterium]|nr:hypothetical protein [Clostridia bacterium]
MKKINKILLIFAIFLLGFSGIIFGCGDKFANLKITTDLQVGIIELVAHVEDEEPATGSFTATVSGASGDIGTNLKYYLENSGLVSVSLTHAENSDKTTVKLTALDYGETDLILRTESGNKTTKVHIIVTLAVDSVEYNEDYKPFAVIGKTTKINTSKCVSFEPNETTQKDVYYEMIGSYNDVEVLDDGRIVVGENAVNGMLRVRATSRYNMGASVDFEVKILRGVDEIVVLDEETRIAEDEVLKLSNNMMAESLKILTIQTPADLENNYRFEYEIVGKDDDLSSDVFGCEEMDTETLALTAIRKGDARLKIVAKLDGYDYVSAPRYITLKSFETPSTVSVVSSQKTENLMIYDIYQNGLGEVVRINVGGANADDRRFVISVANADRDKITIYTGNRNASGGLIQARFYDEHSTNYDIYPTGTTLYIIANSNAVSDSALMNISFIAYGSLNLKGDVVKSDVVLELRRGVTNLRSNKNTFIGDMILMPVSQNGEKYDIIVSTQNGEWTDAVYSNFESDGLLLETQSVKYEDAVVSVDETTKDYVFKATAVHDGVYYLNFFTQNGNHVDITVRVFTKLTEITLTTATIEENSDIGEINYNYTETELPTLDGGNLTIKYRGNVLLSINGYNGTNLQNCTYKNIEYEYNNNYIRIDSLNNILGYAVNNEFINVK